MAHDYRAGRTFESLLRRTGRPYQASRRRLGKFGGEIEHPPRAFPQCQSGRIAKPLLIAQGANDPRVTQAEADQMVEALRTAYPSHICSNPDEGHGCAWPEDTPSARLPEISSRATRRSRGTHTSR